MHSIAADWVSIKPTSRAGNTGNFFFTCLKTEDALPVPAKKKSALLSTFKVLVKKQEGLGQPIRHLYTDSERIFRTVSSGSFSRYLVRHGITPHFSSPYRHEQSLAERPWQTIKHATSATLLHSKLPKNLWDIVLPSVAHVWRRMPSKSTNFTKSPYERVTGRRPDVGHIVPLGMRAYVRRIDGEPADRAHRETFRPTASIGRIVGYAEGYKNAYYVLMDDGSIKVRRDVVVEMNPRAAIRIPPSKPDAPPNASRVAGRESPAVTPQNRESPGVTPPAPSDAGRTPPSAVAPSAPEPRAPSARTKTRNVRLEDITEVPGTHRLTAHNSSKQLHTNRRSVLYDVILNDDPADFDNRIPLPKVIPPNPKSLLAATRPNQTYTGLWTRSARKELKAWFELNEIYPDNQKGERAEHLKRIFALLAKCKYKVDFNTDELIAKTRIVLDGSRMIKGIHFTESYSPTISDRALKTIIHICMIQGMRFYSTDVGNAYLRAVADQPMRVVLPSYWRNKDGSPVRCILNGNAYGKAQAGRLWYFTIDTFLIRNGWTRSNFDPCVYYKHRGPSRMTTGLIVDDQLIGTNDPQLIRQYTTDLRLEFKEVKSHDNVKEIIGIGLKVNGPYVQLDLRHNTEELTKDIPLDSTVTIPMSSTTKEHVKSATRGAKTSTHHKVAGSIGYITDKIRYDLGYARSIIASYANDSTPADKRAILKSLQFLKNTPGRSLLLGGQDKVVKMFAFTDGANELLHPNHGMLCHAIFLSLDSGAIICKTAKSKNVAISSTDPEIRSIHTAMIDIIWHRAFLEELSYTQEEPTVIYTDSQPAIDICYAINTDGASKYLVRKINHIKQEIRRGEIQLKWVRTEDNPADIGTKPLPFSLHDKHAKTLLTGFQMDTIIDGVRTRAANV